MRSIRNYAVATALIFVSASLSAQDNEAIQVTVGDKVVMAKQINAEVMRARLAEKEASRRVQENEVVRQKLQARDLQSQLDTSQSEIAELRSRLSRYEKLLSNNRNDQQQPSQRSTPRETQSEPPLNMRVLNILRGEGITTRARVVVIGDDGSAKGEFQVKDGSAIQGWKVQAINANSIEVTKSGKSFTYGSDGVM